jgi:hypothetical protein
MLFSGNGGVVSEAVTTPGKGNGLGMVQEAIQDHTGDMAVSAAKPPACLMSACLYLSASWLRHR